jgi:uncharacterized RDD family membrane protein YckC
MTDLPSNLTPAAVRFGDKLTIETPEQTALEFAVAGIGSRFLALALDTVIQLVAGLIFGAGVGLLAIFLPKFPRASLWFVAFILLFFFVLYFGYFASFEAIWNGQTPGKRRTGIRVIKDSGHPITTTEAIARNLLRIVDQLPAFYAVGIASVLLSRQNKRLGDFVAGTIVVHEKALQEIRPFWHVSQTAAAVTYGSERLTEEELALIETFLNRREALAPDVRFHVAEQIANRIRHKLSLPPADLPSTEKLLEALARDRRSSARYG